MPDGIRLSLETLRRWAQWHRRLADDLDRAIAQAAASGVSREDPAYQAPLAERLPATAPSEVRAAPAPSCSSPAPEDVDKGGDPASDHRRRVLDVLDHYGGWVGRAAIARKTGLGRDRVTVVLKALRDAGQAQVMGTRRHAVWRATPAPAGGEIAQFERDRVARNRIARWPGGAPKLAP